MILGRGSKLNYEERSTRLANVGQRHWPQKANRGGSIRARRQRRILQQGGLLLLTLAGSLLFLIPWFWMIFTAGKSADEIWRVPPVWIPEQYQWQNYIDAWNSGRLFTFFRNTAFISLLNVIAVVFSCSLAAFAFSRIEFPGRDMLFVLVLAR